jgi:hypothetical protein
LAGDFMDTKNLRRTRQGSLYELGKQANLADGTSRHIQELEKIYLYINDLLEHGKDHNIHEALERAYHYNEERIFNHIQATTLSLIHDITFEANDKTYNSVMILFPHFVSTIHHGASYPDYDALEKVFRDTFYDYQLLFNHDQLVLAPIKMNCHMAEKMKFSEWYHLHKAILATSLMGETNMLSNFSNQSAKTEFGQELNFFVACIVTEYDKQANRNAPPLEHIDADNELLRKALHHLNERIDEISAQIKWIVLPPGDYMDALETGMMMQQDVIIDSIFQKYANNPLVEFALLPIQENNDLILAVWNPHSKKTEVLIPIHDFYQANENMVDELLQKISFFEIRRTYLIEDGISICDLNEDDFDFQQIMNSHEILLLQKQPDLQPTLH